MKVVFPRKGSLVLLKQDLETLEAFYNTSLLSSKILDIYKTSNVMVQIGNFNYVPSKSALVLYKASLLTIENMRKILGIYRETTAFSQAPVQPVATPPTKSQILQENNEAPISDNDLLSNPFFQTLKPLN